MLVDIILKYYDLNDGVKQELFWKKNNFWDLLFPIKYFKVKNISLTEFLILLGI